MSVTINGVTYSGNDVHISGRRVHVDGHDVTELKAGELTTLKIEGSLASLKVVQGTNIDITVTGDVKGDVDCNTLKVNGSVGGAVDANSVVCGDVGGNVDCNTVTCGAVKGNVDANVCNRR